MQIDLGGHAPQADLREETLGSLTIRSPNGLRTPERLLIEALPARCKRILTVGDTEGIVALAARHQHPDAEVHHLQWDAYEGARTAQILQRYPELPITLHVAPDIAGGPFDAILLRGPRENLLLREFIEEAHDALKIGGRLIVTSGLSPQAAVDIVRKAFGRADRQSGVRRDTQLVSAKRTKEKTLHKRRARLSEKHIGDIPIKLEVRPGVFGFKSFDGGTRALLQHLTIAAGSKVIDIGAGAGALGIYAAKIGAAEVTFVDSSTRAVEVCNHNIEFNAIAGATVLLRADLENIPSGFDVAVMNPPYYADFRIAKSFINASLDMLRPGGKLWLVAKAAEEHRAIVDVRFGNSELVMEEDYGIITATR